MKLSGRTTSMDEVYEWCERCNAPEVEANYMCNACLTAEENYYIELYNNNLEDDQEPAEYIERW
jgi:hypothetical protein